MVNCSFCGRKEGEVREFFRGANACICDECVKLCHRILEKEEAEASGGEEGAASREALGSWLSPPPPPEELHRTLDRFVVGQDEAKRVVSVAVYTHYMRLWHELRSGTGPDGDGGRRPIEKSNILMIGPTGTGKTLIARTLARILKVPFVLADATFFTEAGYVGDDVETILTRLYHAAGRNVARAECGIVFLDELDKLRKQEMATSKDVSGRGVQIGLLRMLEDGVVTVPKELGGKVGLGPTVQIRTDNILFICAGAFVGLSEITARRVGSTSIGFDPAGKASSKERADKSYEILHALGSEDLIEYGLLAELVGRLPVVCLLKDLSRDEMRRILTEPENSIVEQYKRLAALEEVELEFEEGALQAIVDEAMERRLGARGLRSLLERVMQGIFYHLPAHKPESGRLLVTAEHVLAVLKKGVDPWVSARKSLSRTLRKSDEKGVLERSGRVGEAME